MDADLHVNSSQVWQLIELVQPVPIVAMACAVLQRSGIAACCRWKRCVPIACAEAERKFASMGRFVLVLVRSAKCWPAFKSRRW